MGLSRVGVKLSSGGKPVFIFGFPSARLFHVLWGEMLFESLWQRLFEKYRESHGVPSVLEPSTPEIEDEFDPEYYLARYEDLRVAGVEPRAHWVNHGRKEGRISVPVKWSVTGSETDFDPNRKTLLVVVHEASFTGAPILGFNIVECFMDRYNIVTVMLGGGRDDR